MKRCSAIQAFVVNAIMTIALAPCKVHSHELVTEVYRHWDCGGVTIHANGRRRNDDKGQSATHNANRFSARVSHLEFTLSDLRVHVSRKPGWHSDSGPPSRDSASTVTAGPPTAMELTYALPPPRLPSPTKRKRIATRSRSLSS
jgi:hypothetical protein